MSLPTSSELRKQHSLSILTANRNPSSEFDSQFSLFSSPLRRFLPVFGMSNLRATCRPYAAITSIYSYRGRGGLTFSPSARNPNLRIPSPCHASSPFVLGDQARMGPASRASSRRTITRVSNWKSEKSPYETLGIFSQGLLCFPCGQLEVN